MITILIIISGIVVVILGGLLIVANAHRYDKVLKQIKRIVEASIDDRTKLFLIAFLLDDEKPRELIVVDPEPIIGPTIKGSP